MNQPAPSPLAVDCALATVGLDSILRGEPRYTKEMAEKAAGLRGAVTRALNAYLASTEFEDAAPNPPFDYDEVNKLLTDSGKPQQVKALHDAIPDQALAAGVLDAASRAIQYLNSRIPRRVVTSLVGSDVVPPSRQDQAEFARAWWVACDPMIVLRDMQEQSLTEDMVTTLATLFPALYLDIKQQVHARLVAMKAKRKRWVPSSKKSAQLARLMQVSPDDLADVAAIQATFAPATPAAPAAPSGGLPRLNIKTDDLQTPGQKASS
jgi:hypothetical protein